MDHTSIMCKMSYKNCFLTVEYFYKIVLYGSFKLFPFYFDFLFVVELDIMDDMFDLN